MGIRYPSFYVTKREACQRQLETAIDLYFGEKDALAIHTLAAAAREVAEVLARGRQRPFSIRQFIDENIPADRLKEFHDSVFAPQNYLKHADRDANATLEFSGEQTELFMLDACLALESLGMRRPLIRIFLLWAVLTFADDLIDVPSSSALPAFRQASAGKTRAEFYSYMLPLVLRSFGEVMPGWDQPTPPPD